MEDEDIDFVQREFAQILTYQERKNKELEESLVQIDGKHIAARSAIEKIQQTLYKVHSIIPDSIKPETPDQLRIKELLEPPSTVNAFETLFPQSHTGGYSWPVRLECEFCRTDRDREQAAKAKPYSSLYDTLTTLDGELDLEAARGKFGDDVVGMIDDVDKEIWGEAKVAAMESADQRMGRLFPHLPKRTKVATLPGLSIDLDRYRLEHPMLLKTRAELGPVTKGVVFTVKLLVAAQRLKEVSARTQRRREMVLSVGIQRRELFMYSGAERRELERAVEIQEQRIVTDTLVNDVARKQLLVRSCEEARRWYRGSLKEHLPPSRADVDLSEQRKNRLQTLLKVERAQEEAQLKLKTKAKPVVRRTQRSVSDAERQQALRARYLQMGIPLAEAKSLAESEMTLSKSALNKAISDDRRLSIVSTSGSNYVSMIQDPFARDDERERPGKRRSTVSGGMARVLSRSRFQTVASAEELDCSSVEPTPRDD
ncbi:hypothetical protein J8273_3220 [Carpediemonas membranifera]|uniref:Uncharacterized protein n=1 Tax=Carpediemonas membranifera TaxID=201153 RepID=A0A8J6AS68_9EUKA|nr:hypothetical protein J8273_3220 [Carpediemonas membranifera]|eukprot:KAG9393091.1 hypothetical protein J8273_3220 [Carpediemonas membranifera]